MQRECHVVCGPPSVRGNVAENKPFGPDGGTARRVCSHQRWPDETRSIDVVLQLVGSRSRWFSFAPNADTFNSFQSSRAVTHSVRVRPNAIRVQRTHGVRRLTRDIVVRNSLRVYARSPQSCSCSSFRGPNRNRLSLFLFFFCSTEAVDDRDK